VSFRAHLTILPYQNEVKLCTHSYLVYSCEVVRELLSLEQADIVQYIGNFSHSFMVGNSVCIFKYQ